MVERDELEEEEEELLMLWLVSWVWEVEEPEHWQSWPAWLTVRYTRPGETETSEERDQWRQVIR